MATLPVFLTVKWRLIVALSLGLTVYGCQKPLVAVVIPASSRTTPATHYLPAFSPAHVQSLPLYRQAEQECSRQQFLQATDTLARLAADKSLSAPEAAFVREQRAVCLKDAGLPVPPVPVANSSVPTLASLPSRPLTVGQANCGPRALLLVCRQLGIRTSVEELSKQAGTNAQGTSLEGLAIAAKAVGLKTEGVQVSREALSETDTPALAYVNGNHFVALLALHGNGENGTATIHDPNAAGEETISQERMLRLCSGYLLLLHK